MGVLDKILGAGLKKAAAKETGQASAKTIADLRRRITTYEKDLKTKNYGKGKIQTKSGIEARLSAHRSYLKKALGGKPAPSSMDSRSFGGKKKPMATKKTKPNKAAQDKATKEGKLDTAIQKAKGKEGPLQKQLHKVGHGTKTDLPVSNPAAYDQANQAAVKANKKVRNLQKKQKIKKVGSKESKMQSTDVKKKGIK